MPKPGEALREDGPALVPLDVDLPDGDGGDLLLELGNVPVLVLSGKKGAEAGAIEHGAPGFLPKPSGWTGCGSVWGRRRGRARLQRARPTCKFERNNSAAARENPQGVYPLYCLFHRQYKQP